MRIVTEDEKTAYIEGVKQLKGGHRRQFMARIVRSLGYGGQRWANLELGWNRSTIQKGLRELEQGIPPLPPRGGPGRPRAEDLLPNLLIDIKAIVETETQTDPTFDSTRLYTRVTAPAILRALREDYGYSCDELPCEDTIRVKLNMLGYRLRKVQKSKPKKNT